MSLRVSLWLIKPCNVKPFIGFNHALQFVIAQFNNVILHLLELLPELSVLSRGVAGRRCVALEGLNEPTPFHIVPLELLHLTRQRSGLALRQQHGELLVVPSKDLL